MKRALTVIIALSILVLLFLAGSTLCLEVRTRSGSLLFRRPVRPGERITLSFIHSVARRPVDETWEVTPRGVLVLRETVYDSFGAGLPTDLAFGEKLELREGRLKITGMNRELPVVSLAVGRIAEHQLVFNDGRVRLADLASPGSLVEIRVFRRPFWCALSGRRVFKRDNRLRGEEKWTTERQPSRSNRK